MNLNYLKSIFSKHNDGIPEAALNYLAFKEETNKFLNTERVKSKSVHSDNSMLEVGKYYKRPHWEKGLYIHIKHNRYAYYVGSEGKVGINTISKRDFVEVDKDGNMLNIFNKGLEMKNTNYIGGNYYLVEINHDVNSGDINIGSGYIYKCDIHNDSVVGVSVGDMVVVENSRGFNLGVVMNVYPNTIQNAALVKKATAWVVDKVDLTSITEKRENTERREYIINQLNEKKENLQVLEMYALLAKVDPEAGKLIEELKTLGN